MDFAKFKPIPRLGKRWCLVTEKLDGTNGCAVIEEITEAEFDEWEVRPNSICRVAVPIKGSDEYTHYAVYAQSRNRFLTIEEDNQGFGGWVYEYAEELVEFLGVGHHYGEWWGSKIQRAYGLKDGERYFSLFNHRRWFDKFEANECPIPNLRLIPLLYEGPWDELEIDECMDELKQSGSYAQPYYLNPEGIVVFDSLTGNFYKKTFDDNHKGVTNAGS